VISSILLRDRDRYPYGLYLYEENARLSRVVIDPDYLTRNHLRLSTLTLSDEERIASVRYAQVVDDGEAETIAVAELRKLQMISDDAGALRLASQIDMKVTTTLELIQAWSLGESPEVIRSALASLRRRANYAPPRNHPLRRWFLESISER